nr:hypothetical protein [Gemmatimonadaceae bacterium]
MSMRREWLYVAGAATLLLVGVLVTIQALAPTVPNATVGGRAPAFEAQLVPPGAN